VRVGLRNNLKESISFSKKIKKSGLLIIGDRELVLVLLVIVLDLILVMMLVLGDTLSYI